MIQFENAVERYNKMILAELKEAGIICWIGGGCLRDYFMGVPIKTDIDLFFPNAEQMNKCMAYLKKKAAIEIWNGENGAKFQYGDYKYDIIKHYFPDPQATIDAFDFTVSMFAIDTEKVYYGESSFIDLSKRQLMLNKLPFPASTMSRAFRYYKKGFVMCKGEMKKLVEAIQAMPKTEQPQQQEEEQTNSSADAMWNGID